MCFGLNLLYTDYASISQRVISERYWGILLDFSQIWGKSFRNTKKKSRNLTVLELKNLYISNDYFKRVSDPRFRFGIGYLCVFTLTGKERGI